jgi:hypothetical protein
MGEFGRWFGREFPRVLASLGPAIAVVGVVVYAMATSFRETRDSDVTIAVVLMVVGLVLFIAGVLAIRAGMGAPSDPPDEPVSSRAAGQRTAKRG